MAVSEQDQKTQTERVETTRRYVRRKGGPGLAFIPYGLIPALGLALLTLFALIPFASYWIEENAEQAALTSLRAEGESWATVSASGQWITLTGQAPSAERAARAVDLVRDVQAPTLFGQARPVTRVIDRTTLLGSTTDPANAVATEDAETTAPEASSETDVTPPPAQTAQDLAEACDQFLRALLADSNIEFATGSARIAPTSAGLLDQLARAVIGCDVGVTVEGHTDSTGSAALNERLSLARAEAVRDALVIRGASADLLDAEGYGAAWPVASNETPEGREQNRRIEFSVRASDGAQE